MDIDPLRTATAIKFFGHGEELFRPPAVNYVEASDLFQDYRDCSIGGEFGITMCARENYSISSDVLLKRKDGPRAENAAFIDRPELDALGTIRHLECRHPRICDQGSSVPQLS